LVHALAVPGIEPSFYRYQPLGHRLAHAASGRSEAELAALLNDHPVEGASIVVLLAADFARVSLGKYGGQAYRLLLLEAGHIAQNILLVGSALGLVALPICGLRDEELARVAGLGFPHEVVVYAIAIGRGSPR
jgi:SagB-type dehydrogenase family enzyme